MRKITLLFTMLLFVTMSWQANAQVSFYNFSETTGNTFSSISTTGTDLGLGDDEKGLASIGFTFHFNGVDYTDVSVSSNGYLRMGDVVAGNAFNTLAGTGVYLNLLGVLWDDLNPDDGGNIYYETQGTAPNRTFTVEYNAVHRYGAGGGIVIAQITLYETSNNFEYKYGASSPIFASASIGFTADPGASGNYFSITPGTPATTSTTTPNNALTEAPADGVNYLFTYAPPSCLAPTALVSANITQTSADLTWTQGGTETNWEYTLLLASDPAPTTAGTTTTTMSYGATSLSSGTNYVFYVRADCTGGDYSSWSSIAFTTLFPPPANDLCSTPTTAVVGNGICGADITGTNVSATNSGEATTSCAGANYAGGDIWYEFMVPAGKSEVTFKRSASAFSTTYVALYEGSCGTLTELFCSTNATVNFTSLTAGNTYLMRLFDWGNDDFGDVTFCLSTPTDIPNCSTSNFPADTATDVASECGGNLNLTWTSDTTGNVATPDNYDVYFGTTANPSLVGNTINQSYQVNVSASTTYYYKIVPKNGSNEATGCTELSFTTGTVDVDGGSGGVTNEYFFANNNYTGGTSANAYSYDDPVAAGHTEAVEPLTSGTNDFDDGYQTVTLPFTFRYYGVDYTEAHMGTNGYLSFGQGYTSGAGGTALGSTTDPDNMIAVAMMDLDDRTDGKLYYGPIGTDKYVFTWYHYHDYFDDNEWITAQLVLQKNADPATNGSFEIRYNQAESSGSIPDFLSDAVIGCEDIDGNATTEYAVYRENGTGGPIFCSPLTIGFGPSASAVVLAVEDISSIEGFTIYPNPVKGLLKFNSRDNIDTINIYNILGQEVLRTQPNTSNTQVDMTNLPTGVYVVKVQVGEQVGSYRVIKE